MFAEACLLTGTSHHSFALPPCDWPALNHMTFIKSWSWLNMVKILQSDFIYRCVSVCLSFRSCSGHLSILYLMCVCLSVFPQLLWSFIYTIFNVCLFVCLAVCLSFRSCSGHFSFSRFDLRKIHFWPRITIFESS